jgi:AcrR family transcriptional regulator
LRNSWVSVNPYPYSVRIDEIQEFVLSRGKRTAPAERQSQILNQALKLFSAQGFQNTSLQQVADDCGISQSAIFYYYPSKDVLLKALVSKILANNHTLVAKMMQDKDTNQKRIEKIFVGNLDWALAFPQEAQVIFLLYYSASVDTVFCDIYKTILTNIRLRIYELLKAGVVKGEFSKTLDCKSTAELLHDALLGGIVNIVATQGGKSLRNACIKKWRSLIGRQAGGKSPPKRR